MASIMSTASSVVGSSWARLSRATIAARNEGPGLSTSSNTRPRLTPAEKHPIPSVHIRNMRSSIHVMFHMSGVEYSNGSTACKYSNGNRRGFSTCTLSRNSQDSRICDPSILIAP